VGNSGQILSNYLSSSTVELTLAVFIVERRARRSAVKIKTLARVAMLCKSYTIRFLRALPKMTTFFLVLRQCHMLQSFFCILFSLADMLANFQVQIECDLVASSPG